MNRPTISSRTYSRVTLIALIALGLIVVTGGAVRLTGSGLGCPDWPTCTKSRLVAPVQYHALVEFTNRSITGLVSIAVIVAVLASFWLKPKRKDLTLLASGLVLGVVGQIILGGITVLFDLNPALVAAHFALSMVIIANAVVLHFRAREVSAIEPRLETAPIRGLSKLIVGATALAILLGTVVTGSGPHGGDEKAKRFNFVIGDVARLHGTSVMILLAIVLYTAWLIKKNRSLSPLLSRVEVLLGVLVAQAAVGYTQYFTGVPALLVGIHLAGAVSVWCAAWWFALEAHQMLAPAHAITRSSSTTAIVAN